MAFYNPPGAPAQGGLTVDASRYQNLQAHQYQPVPNPFAKAYELKKQAMEMKRAERAETEAISGEVLAKMQNEIFAMGDDASHFNPDDILQGGKFNKSELEKRRFTSTLKSAAWTKYQRDAKTAGGVANRESFEQVWGAAKKKEDSKIINEMWADVQSNRMTEKEFNLAVRDEGGEVFRDYYKDISQPAKEQLQLSLEQAKWDAYTPGYETFWEGMFNTGPTDTELSDKALSPAVIGTTVTAGLTAAGLSPTIRGAVAAPFKSVYGASGGNLRAFKVETNKLKTLRQEARALGFNPDTGKIIKGTKASPSLQMKYNAWNKSADGGVELKRLESLEKAGTKVNQDKLKELQSKRNKFKSDLSSNKQKIDKAKKKLSAQQKVVADKKKLYRSKGKGFTPRGYETLKGKIPGIVKGPGSLALKGYGAKWIGDLAAMPTRALLGDDTKGKKVTNETIEAVGTQLGMGKQYRGMVNNIISKVRQKGAAWALKRIASKGGIKLATSVGIKAIIGIGGGALTGGALAAVSGTLLTKDLYDIYQILSE